MKSKHTKTWIVVLMMVAIVSLAIGLILTDRQRKTRTEMIDIRSAQKQIGLIPHPSENHNSSQIRSNLNKQAAVTATTLYLQPYESPDRTAESAGEILADPNEFSDNADAFLREEIQVMLAEAIAAEFPELKMDETQLAALTGTVISIRESLQAIRDMQRTEQNVEALVQWQEMRDQAMEDFERITGMSALRFMLQAPADGGIDHE